MQGNGEPTLVRWLAQVRYGYAIYLGDSLDRPEMMPAAQKSLELAIAFNQGTFFQNLYLAFALLGRTPAQQTAVLPIPFYKGSRG